MASEASINDWIIELSGDELRQELASRGLDTAGTKAELQRRLANEVYMERGIDQPTPTPSVPVSDGLRSNDPPPPYEFPASSTVTTANVQSAPFTNRSILDAPRTSSPLDANRGLEIEEQGRPQAHTGTIPRTTARQNSGLAAAVTTFANAHRTPLEPTDSGYLSQTNGILSQTNAGYLSQTNAGSLAQNNTGYLGQTDRLSLGNVQRPGMQNGNATGPSGRSFLASTAISNGRNVPNQGQAGGYLNQFNSLDNRGLVSDVPNPRVAGNTIRLNNGYNSANPRQILHQIDNILPPGNQEGYLHNFPNDMQNNVPRATGYLNNNNNNRQQNFSHANREPNARSVRFNDANAYNSDRRLIIPTPMSAFDFMRKWNLKYSGRRDEDSEEFLRRVKEGRFIMHISDDDLFGILPFFLTGVALQWFRINSDNWINFEQFEEAWRARFSDTDFQHALMENARRRTQGEREPVADYLTYIKAMFNRMVPPMGPQREIELALRNMLPRIQVRIDRSEIFTFAELEALAVRKEKSLAIARSFKLPPGVEDSLLPDLAYRDQRIVRPVRQALANLCLEEIEDQDFGREANLDYAEELPPEFEDLNAIGYQGDRRHNNGTRPMGNTRPPNNRPANQTQTLCYRLRQTGSFFERMHAP